MAGSTSGELPAPSNDGPRMPRPEVPRYFRIACQFWDDEAVSQFSDQLKLFALYTLTNKHRTLEGFYVIPVEYIAADLNWPLRRVKSLMEELCHVGFARYDPKTRLLLIRNALKYQQPDSLNVQKGVLARVHGLPDNQDMLREFLTLARKHCLRKGLSVFAQGLPALLEREFPHIVKGHQAVTAV